MKSILENDKFNTKIETSEWRYSASIVGLLKYFNYLINMGECTQEDLYEVEDDILKYNKEEITEERYLMFVEEHFHKAMHHRYVEQILDSDDLSEEQIKLVDEKLKANSIMKKIFVDIKYTKENKSKILKLIEENRYELIKETFKGGKSLYDNFSNKNALFTNRNKICRVKNYNIDVGRKTKSVSYNWNYKTYVYEDEIEFDFIPFAFSKSYESFFINNNYSVDQLYKSNFKITESENPRNDLFDNVKASSDFIDYDVEVIVKNRDKDYFETLYIRKKAIKIFKGIGNYKAIQFFYEMNKGNFLNIEKEVTNRILNNLKLDSIIEMLFKAKKELNYTFNITTLIKINILIYGGDTMDNKMKAAYACAKQVQSSIPKNKVNSYKQKLISSITLRDYERFSEILLQLSSYSGVVFTFAYDLFEDFDKNKNIAYTFVNALNGTNNNGGK